MKIGIKYETSDKICYNWDELLHEIEKDKELIPWYKELFDLARLLSLNNVFINALVKIRAETSFDKIDPKLLESLWWELEEYDTKTFNELQKRAKIGVGKLFKFFDLDKRWELVIRDLVVLGYFSPGQELYYEGGYATWLRDKKEFKLIIHHPISKNHFHKIVDSIYKNSKEMIDKLPKLNQLPEINNRDARIVELRDQQKMKYSDIADKIVKELEINNSDGKVNEDSIKTAYKRAKQKILSINRR